MPLQGWIAASPLSSCSSAIGHLQWGPMVRTEMPSANLRHLRPLAPTNNFHLLPEEHSQQPTLGVFFEPCNGDRGKGTRCARAPGSLIAPRSHSRGPVLPSRTNIAVRWWPRLRYPRASHWHRPAQWLATEVPSQFPEHLRLLVG